MLNYNQANNSFDYVTKNQVSIKGDCPFFKVKCLKKTLEEEEDPFQVVIEYQDGVNHGEFTMPTKILGSLANLVTYFNQQGVMIKDYHKHDVNNILINQIRKSPLQYQHKTLGWKEVDGQWYYLQQTAQIGNYISTCTRNFDFTAGSQSEYEKMLKKVVYPSKELTLAYMIGFSAVVSSWLEKQNLADLGTIVLNINGRSSSGKSTVEQLLLSPFGNPVFKKTGLGVTHSGTLNGIIDALGGINGMPRVIDDLTQNTQINITELIYTIAQKETKKRCGKDWNNIAEGWSGLVVISSEEPILDSCRSGGLYGRVLFADNIQWTKTAEEAETIKAVVQKNYGFKGADFAKFIQSKGMDELSTLLTKHRQDLLSRIELQDAFTARISNKLAVISMTVDLFKECFQAPFQWTAIELLEPLVTAERVFAIERDPVKQVLDILWRYFESYRNKRFDIKYSNDEVYPAQQRHDGSVFYQDLGNTSKVLICIDTKVMKSLMSEHGFNQWKTAADILKKKGWLLGEKNRKGEIVRNDKCVNGTRCFCFLLDNKINPYEESSIMDDGLAAQNQDSSLKTSTPERRKVL